LKIGRDVLWRRKGRKKERKKKEEEGERECENKGRQMREVSISHFLRKMNHAALSFAKREKD
jgi:hypothetical protein